jgi:hypothetical protein
MQITYLYSDATALIRGENGSMTAPKIEVFEEPNYRTIIVNGVFGGHRPGYFETIIYTDELIAKESLGTAALAPERAFFKRTLQCRLVMDPVTAKSVAKWLTEHIDQYEKLFGKIPTPEDRVITP